MYCVYCCPGFPGPWRMNLGTGMWMWLCLCTRCSPFWVSSIPRHMAEMRGADAKRFPHSPLRASLLVSQPHPQQYEAEQRADVVECACPPEGGAVAQIWVAAVDADSGQLLLLAVPGCGTAAGQNDTQGRYRGRKEGDRQTDRQSGRQGRVMSWCLAQQEKKERK